MQNCSYFIECQTVSVRFGCHLAFVTFTLSMTYHARHLITVPYYTTLVRIHVERDFKKRVFNPTVFAFSFQPLSLYSPPRQYNSISRYSNVLASSQLLSRMFQIIPLGSLEDSFLALGLTFDTRQFTY